MHERVRNGVVCEEDLDWWPPMGQRVLVAVRGIGDHDTPTKALRKYTSQTHVGALISHVECSANKNF